MNKSLGKNANFSILFPPIFTLNIQNSNVSFFILHLMNPLIIKLLKNQIINRSEDTKEEISKFDSSKFLQFRDKKDRIVVLNRCFHSRCSTRALPIVPNFLSHFSVCNKVWKVLAVRKLLDGERQVRRTRLNGRIDGR